MARRKLGTSNTTISISWEDKDEFRKFAKFVKKTRNGDMYESDAILFHKILTSFKIDNNSTGESNSTYPKIQVHDQQD
jgi:hypothetical protein